MVNLQNKKQTAASAVETNDSRSKEPLTDYQRTILVFIFLAVYFSFALPVIMLWEG